MPLTDPSLPLQKALVAKLKAAGGVGNRVFDSVEAGAAFPYISIGDVQVVAELGEETDAADSAITIHAWSRVKGFVEVKQIGASVIAALHDQSLNIDSGAVQSMLLESVRYLRDPDGLTSHGVLTFNILTDANS